jgi:hypothetical protein
MKAIHHVIKLTTLAAAVLLPCSLLASPIVVAINDVPNGSPVIHVYGAPDGYDINTVLPNNPLGGEDGALITLIGVNNYFDPGALPEWEGRFTIPTAPNPARTAVDIVWVSHDADVFGLGDLQIGFNSAWPGTYYATHDDLGIVTDNWVEVYTSDVVVVFFKPHTYRLRN